MPFTPLHMGPGLAIKAVAGKHFSLITYGLAQIAIDIEPLIGMIIGSRDLHVIFHNYLAAIIIASIVIWIAPPIRRIILHRWWHELAFFNLAWLDPPESTTRMLPIIIGAYVGTISHIALDSITHSMAPFAPWSNYNGLEDMLSLSAMYQLCIWSGVIGVGVWAAMAWYKRTTQKAG